MGRLAWFIATQNLEHGYHAGVIDEEYCNRIEAVYDARIKSRFTTDQVRNFLARRTDILQGHENWAQKITEVWHFKFPESTIMPDPGFQQVRDPNLNKDLPHDLFTSEDFKYIRNKELRPELIYNRQQHAVTSQVPALSPNWDQEQQELVQNAAHASLATQQVGQQADEKVIQILQEFDQYINHFWQNGQDWEKSPCMERKIFQLKNVTDELAFCKNMFLVKEVNLDKVESVIVPINEIESHLSNVRTKLTHSEHFTFYHPKWLQTPMTCYLRQKTNNSFQLNSAEVANLHHQMVKFLSLPRMSMLFEPIVRKLKGKCHIY